MKRKGLRSRIPQPRAGILRRGSFSRMRARRYFDLGSQVSPGLLHTVRRPHRTLRPMSGCRSSTARWDHVFLPHLHPAEDDQGLLDTPRPRLPSPRSTPDHRSRAGAQHPGRSPTGDRHKFQSANAPIDIMVKRYQGRFTFSPSPCVPSRDGEFQPPRRHAGAATVLGENRTIPISGGSFSDSFDGYAVHIYQLSP